MRVLVTGAAGFIGSHITLELLDEGLEVVGLDDLSTGHRRNLPAPQARWQFFLGDIRDKTVCIRAMGGVDAVIHLAGRNSVPRSLVDPCSAIEVNVMGGMNLLEAARSEDVQRFIYASSSSIYGDNPALPKVETQARCPLSPYAASKASFEHLARVWTSSFGLPTLGLRFFNVFGPRQDVNSAYAAVVPLFAEAALTGTRPIIHGDGTYSRDFTYVDNVVNAVMLALCAPDAMNGSVLNVGCGGRVSVLDLWNAIAVAANHRGTPRFGPIRAGDMPHTHADISQARRLLGYEPTVSFRDGIQRTIAWYASQRLEVSA